MSRLSSQVKPLWPLSILPSTPTIASSLPRDWHFDASSCLFISDASIVRVLAVPNGEAAGIPNAHHQVEELYRGLFQVANHPVEYAANAVARAFQESTDPIEAARPARTVLVYYDAKSDVPTDHVAAYTRVVYDGERVVISSIAHSFELSEDAQHQVLEAIEVASEELAMIMTNDALKYHSTQPGMIWRGQLGASDFLKSLFERDGYSTSLTDRLEMTAYVKELGSADASIEETVVDGIEIRVIDLATDDIKAVYDVVKDAFGPSPPSFAAWKRHYAEQPRFAADLSFVAWQGDKAVSASLLELIVDGEGGGEDEVHKAYGADSTIDDATRAAALTQPLQFAEDYDERREKIRASAKTAYVCGVATLPSLRGKRIAQTLLRHNFRAAAHAGLESVYLGTDRQNPAAVRAYARAGMVETMVENHGMITAKLVTAST